MILDNLYKAELIMVIVEQIEDIEKWKPLLLELAKRDMSVLVTEEKLVFGEDFLNEEGLYNIQIICSVEEFIELAPQLKKLDEEGMLSVRRTYQELEDFYYDEGEEL
jgi:hypothetical protein